MALDLKDLPAWVSLGGGCRVAYQLRRCHLRTSPTPFDWIRTPFPAVIELIATDFRDFLSTEDLHLQEGPPRVLRDRRHGIVLPHDADIFEAGGGPAIQSRYQPRIAALQQILHERRHVALVRRGIELPEAEALLAVLHRKHPRVRFTVVGVHDAEEAARATQRTGVFLRLSARTSVRGWAGCDAAWDRMLETAVADVLAASPPTSLPWLLLRGDWYKLEMALAQLLVQKARLRRKLPSVVIQALIAGEDHRFLDHNGIDFWAVARALFGLASGKRLGGGSTIEQQLYRTLTNRRGRTIARKVRELLGARFIDTIIDKETIASIYLTVAYFGAHMNGIEQACAHLKLDLAAMTADDAAALIARLKYPEPRHPNVARLEQIARRAAWIRQRMTPRSPHAAHAYPS